MPIKPAYHKPIQRTVFTRPPSHQRGYDRDWARLRRRWFAAHPLCEHCLAQGITTAAREGDHVVPFRGRDDPLRLDGNNLQSLCRRCHAIKTAGGQ